MKKFGLIGLFLLAFAGNAHAQGPQCRTSTVGASTPNCASEAFVTKSIAGNVTGPNSSTSGDIPSFSDATGKNLQDSGIPSTALPTSGGTAGQHLVSTGGSSNPTFQSGGWVLLNTLTASNSATLTDTTSITATYTEYEIVLETVLPVTNNVTLQLQVKVSGTFQTTGYLATNLFGNGTSTVTQTQTSGIFVSNTSSVSNAGVGVYARVLLSNPAAVVTCKPIHGDFSSYNGTGLITGTTSGCYNGGSAAITGIQLIASSGNLSLGMMKIYGRVN